MKLFKHITPSLELNSLLAVMGLLLISCQTNSKNSKTAATKQIETQHSQLETAVVEDSILLGKHHRKDLEKSPFDQWFNSTYQEYKVDADILNDLEPLVAGMKIKVFMGTWCSDSQYHVPTFFKIMDQANYNYEDFEIYSMTEDKTTPENYEQDLNIINVPTFIFYKDGKEINRIVEYPLDTMEKDILDILQGKPYQNPYAE